MVDNTELGEIKVAESIGIEIRDKNGKLLTIPASELDLTTQIDTVQEGDDTTIPENYSVDTTEVEGVISFSGNPVQPVNSDEEFDLSSILYDTNGVSESFTIVITYATSQTETSSSEEDELQIRSEVAAIERAVVAEQEQNKDLEENSPNSFNIIAQEAERTM